MRVIGSAEELKKEIDKSVKAGLMKSNPLASFVPGDNSKTNYESFDLHRPFVDEIVLVSDSGKAMKREEDLIDVWFDSGAMPYAQHHYPFENKENFHHLFPADYIAEGVDQTRGWFFTLHAIAVMISDSVSFKNIISNGLVLDKNGNKMSKRLGNAVDPFGAIEQYGSDPLRWYMITNAQPWDNLKFDISGVEEAKRKFFGTLYNTYSFFALYANIDKFTGGEPEVPVKERPEIDRWILSLLNTLIKEVGECYDDYDLTRAGRSIQDFVTGSLSNWYVRLNRKRFWGGEMDNDKLSAYQTLYTCLKVVSQLGAPLAPFYMERLYVDLAAGAPLQMPPSSGNGQRAVVPEGRQYGSTEGTPPPPSSGPTGISVHLDLFPQYDSAVIDKALEERMDIAQGFSSMILGLRKKVNIKVRQPLARIMVPVTEPGFRAQFEAVRNLILTEVNVKEVEYIDDADGILVKKIKPDFRALGPRFGKLMKEVAAAVTSMSQSEILKFEADGTFALKAGGEMVTLERGDVEIISEDIPGWLVANEGKLTVALDITVSEELRNEGIAREFVNRIQNLRKESGFEVTDKITVLIETHSMIREAVEAHAGYIGAQTLANSVKLVNDLSSYEPKIIEIDDLAVKVVIKRA
jgi:isoleucyl-tRNA synthetase